MFLINACPMQSHIINQLKHLIFVYYTTYIIRKRLSLRRCSIITDIGNITHCTSLYSNKSPVYKWHNSLDTDYFVSNCTELSSYYKELLWNFVTCYNISLRRIFFLKSVHRLLLVLNSFFTSSSQRYVLTIFQFTCISDIKKVVKQI